MHRRTLISLLCALAMAGCHKSHAKNGKGHKAKSGITVVKGKADAPAVTIRNAFRTRIFWTEAPLSEPGLGFDVVYDLKGDDPKADWKPYLDADKQRIWGAPHLSPQLVHLAVNGTKDELELPLVAGSELGEQAGARDSMTIELHSLHGVTHRGMDLLMAGARKTPQTGRWFTSWRTLTPKTAKSIVHIPSGTDLSALAPLLRATADFALMPAPTPGNAVISFVGRGHVVATVTRGSVDQEAMRVLAKVAGATYAYHGAPGDYLGDLGAKMDALQEQIAKAGGEDLYVYQGAAAEKPFYPVKRATLSPDVLGMLRQNGVALFAKPVDLVKSL